MTRNIYVLQYTSHHFNRFFNLGDDIQTLAVSKLLPRVDGYVCRENLNEIQDDCIVPLNGYFMNSENWPPSPTVRPVPFSFHVQPGSQSIVCSPPGIEYLKKWQPIGCRDRGTMTILQKHGVEAFYSRCVTLTLPRRQTEPEHGEVFITGVGKAEKRIIPRALRREAVNVDQAHVRLPITVTKLKLELAEVLLQQYSSRARLVITSKIHCALPCIAMGIPVVFLYNSKKKDDYRVSIIDDLIGINYVNQFWARTEVFNGFARRKINWNPDPVDIEPLKEEIRASFLKAYERAAA